MILTQIHHNDSFNPNMYKQTYENLALAAETIAGDNVNMNNRVNELQEEKPRELLCKVPESMM